MTVIGIIEEGLGVAGRQLKRCFGEIRERTGLTPYLGTLNVRLPFPVDVSPHFQLPRGICNDDDEWVQFQRCRINGYRGLIIRTSTNHHGSDVLELIAEVNLQQTLMVGPSDEVTIEAELRPLPQS